MQAESRVSPISLVADRHRRAGGNGLEEILRHKLRHPNAAVGGRISRQIARVHADAADNAHEIGHGRAFEMRARRLGIFADVDIWDDDVARGVDVVAVFARDVRHVFLDDGE